MTSLPGSDHSSTLPAPRRDPICLVKINALHMLEVVFVTNFQFVV